MDAVREPCGFCKYRVQTEKRVTDNYIKAHKRLTEKMRSRAMQIGSWALFVERTPIPSVSRPKECAVCIYVHVSKAGHVFAKRWCGGEGVK